uniref:ShKT domain-containing protein n=1 Tax=Panagrolaimus sp. ES5 TaxID=591445 RepID=A0AC34FKK1_9BILA
MVLTWKFKVARLSGKTCKNLAKLPCCRDGIGQLACQGLRKYQAAFFELRCLKDHDFHTTLCCMECRNYIETHKIHPDNAKAIFKAPILCKDVRSLTFCRRFKDHGIGKFSCKDAEFAMRTCRHSCGYCDDTLYDFAKTMPPCK